MFYPFSNIKKNRDFDNLRIPLELNALWTKNNNGKNFAEVGIGLSLISLIQGYKTNLEGDKIEEEYKYVKITTLRVGFRHQKPEGGLMYREGLIIPVTQDAFSKNKMGDDVFYRLWPGFSIGYTF